MTKPAIKFLKKRGVTTESMERFQAGYAKGGFKKHLVDNCHFPIELCVEAGVLKKKEDGTIRDFFYNRIILPVLKKGKTVNLIGRRLEENNKIPKYLNLPIPKKNFYNEQSIKNKEIYFE